MVGREGEGLGPVRSDPRWSGRSRGSHATEPAPGHDPTLACPQPGLPGAVKRRCPPWRGQDGAGGPAPRPSPPLR